MTNSLVERVAKAVGVQPHAVIATLGLFDEGATVPFIARYRKERTGGLDETQIIAIRDTHEQFQELEKRRSAILRSLAEQEVLTPELEKAVGTAASISSLEDLYLPFRPKKRTRATAAREKGLEPLADLILLRDGADPHAQASGFLNPDAGVASIEDALSGALDIIAERIAEETRTRSRMRDLFAKSGILSSRRAGRAGDAEKYRDYYAWSEPAAHAPSHRILALLRGATEKELVVHAVPAEEQAIALLVEMWVTPPNRKSELVRAALTDAYGRLIEPSLENELLSELKKRADLEAVRIFASNLRELLMAPPLGGRTVLGVDPGFRTGCKIVCLDARGNLLHFEPVYPLEPHRKTEEATKVIVGLIEKYRIEAIAVGNGTGGREMLSFCSGLQLKRPVVITMVNESGASVYSASDVAREEFPDQDVTVRGAVSIGRRLMDPLAELVKIDPKSIGVGQYQHDVDQKLLKNALGDVVASCVNSVGVELNTASVQLLAAVAGLSARVARNIVTYRAAHGGFKSRAELAAVSGLGDRTFEQCAGFLRVRDSENPLDASGVHPESYAIVEAMAVAVGSTTRKLVEDPGLRKSVNLEDYVSTTTGMPTLVDIMAELEKPGRDPRSQFVTTTFADDVHEIGDLKPGMQLPGVVTNVTAFGAFVDIGVHQDGLVHISELADRFVKDPAEVVRAAQPVTVTVLSVDVRRRRIGLSMRKDARSRAAGEVPNR
ncbi:MAG TPA: Tex family protein [Spirochaetia bacterium]|nr:Tex family protein [Spirochaetia bacterium]